MSPPPASPARRVPLLHVGLIALACLITFGPILANGFVSWDDYDTLARNPHFNPPSLGGLLYYWQHPHMHLYAPLTYTVWMTLAAIAHSVGDGGPLPAPLFHAASLIFHVLASLVVYTLLRRWVVEPTAALLGALLFALHPVQVEPVAWASGLKDVLCGLLIWTAVWQYCRYASQNSRRAYALALGAFALGMLAKPTAMVTPLILIALEIFVLRRHLRRVAIAIAPWLALSFACAVWTSLSQPPADSVPHVGLLLRPLIATDALAVYLYKLFIPLNLTVDPGRRPDLVLAHGYLWFTWIVPVAAALALFWIRRRLRHSRPESPALIPLAGIIPLICLAPVLGLRSFDFQQYSTVAEHYLYPAMVGPALLVAALLARVFSLRIRRFRAITISTVLLLLLAVVSHVQTYYWKDNLTLFTHAADVNPDSFAAHNSLAATFIDIGRPDRALDHARRAIALLPNYAPYYLTLGNALSALNQLDQAVDAYRKAIALAPDDPSGHSNLGGILARRGDFKGAQSELQRALQLDPQDSQAHLNLGTLYAQQERNADARRELETAIRLNPGSAIAHTNLGFVLLAEGKASEAATHFAAALKINPNYAQAQNGLAQARQR
jgi:Flp pilus assembly protein TadD